MLKIRKYLAVVLALLALMLLSCGTSLGMPKADALLSFLCGDFTCGFSIMENEAEVATASFVREAGRDTLTYDKNGMRVTILFSGGESFLCTAKSETEEALTLPLTLPNTHGAARICETFSTLPSTEGENATVTRTGDGYRLELHDGATVTVWTFSQELIPLSVSCGDMKLTVTSFGGKT